MALSDILFSEEFLFEGEQADAYKKRKAQARADEEESYKKGANDYLSKKYKKGTKAYEEKKKRSLYAYNNPPTNKGYISGKRGDGSYKSSDEGLYDQVQAAKSYNRHRYNQDHKKKSKNESYLYGGSVELI
jgi:hypothetical protein